MIRRRAVSVAVGGSADCAASRPVQSVTCSGGAPWIPAAIAAAAIGVATSALAQSSATAISDVSRFATVDRLEVVAAAEIARSLAVPEDDANRVGGYSGLAWDPIGTRWLAIADARRTLRAMTLDITLDGPVLRAGVAAVHPISRGTTSQVGGVLDLEGIAVLPDGRIVVASEGDQRGDEVTDPALIELGRDFVVRAEIPVRDRYRPRLVDGRAVGVRPNAAFESLAVSGDGMRLYTGVEEPLQQDDEVPGVGRRGRGRLIEFTNDGGRFVAAREFVYPLDEVRAPAGVDVRTGNTGLVDLLVVDARTLLALERGFVVGRDRVSGDTRRQNDIRLFRIDLDGATDVSDADSLRDVPNARPVRKHLLLSLAEHATAAGLSDGLDNFEALAPGPRLPDGAPSLLLVSDDNFSAGQKSLVVLLRPVPRP